MNYKSTREKMNEFDRLIKKMSQRCDLTEKTLEFTNLQQAHLKWDQFEIQVRNMVMDMYKPCQERVISLQDKVGDMCQMYQQLQIESEKRKEDVNQALGLGKGTLKSQIMQDVDKSIRSISGRVQNFQNEESAYRQMMENAVKGLEEKLKIW